MRRMWKYLMMLVVAVGMFSGMTFMSFAANGDIPSGVIDESYGQITWGIDWKGHLTVEGTGDLTPPDRGFEDVPWYKYRERILSAKISVRGMKNASFLFADCKKLKYVDLNDFQTENVTNMSYMFGGCEALERIEWKKFNTDRVTNMAYMFYDCKSLKALDVSGFHTRNVKDFRCMFQDCANITELDLSNFELGAPHSYMLTGCWKLEKLRTPKKITYSYEVLGLPLQYQTQQWYDDQGKTCTVVKSGVSKSFLLTKIENQNFRDVYNDWYREYVTYVSKKGLMKGYNQFFSPNDAITRGMVVQTLYNMEGRPEVTDYKACLELKDVYQDWYTDAVCWAYNEGITTGYDDTKTFETDKSVTREELAAFLYRYAMYKEYNSSQQGDLGNLQNVDKVSPYAKDAVSWAVGAGLISGIEIKQNGSVIAKDLAPQGTATRAQMAAILMRFCEAYQIQLPDKQLGIPEDAFEWKGHYYAIFDNVSTWELAKVYCEAQGGHLATITSPEENEAVYSFIKENGYTSAYFGLSDKAKEGTWSWVTGEETAHTNWNAEEPGGGRDENYAMFFYLYEDGTWNDGAFKENVHDGGNAYICEWE